MFTVADTESVFVGKCGGIWIDPLIFVRLWVSLGHFEGTLQPRKQ